MRSKWSQRLLAILQLTRLALVFTAIADSLANYFLRVRWRVGPGVSVRQLVDAHGVLSIIFMSVGLYGFGMSLNDIIDHRRDRQISPNRPLPSGRIGLRGAHVIAAGLISLAIFAGFSYSLNDIGDWMSLILVVWTAMLITFYDFAGKYLVWPGLVTLGLIRMFHAAIPAPNLPLVWQPMWLLNHVCILSAVAYQ